MVDAELVAACSVEFNAELHTTKSHIVHLDDGHDTPKAFSKLKQ